VDRRLRATPGDERTARRVKPRSSSTARRRTAA
jgi:hypothetical protein